MNPKMKGLYKSIINVLNGRQDKNLNHYSIFTFGSSDDYQLWYFGEDPWEDDADGNLFELHPIQWQIDRWQSK